ncbi:hypothetical protein LO762_11520 [Actinocorallia sp. API 0066]|uniref:lactate/malate family dehydrogenase n=1 Tax=Actinocorallia sp. API 0066 TaxID=2896846 RepID=UPI001E3CF3D8|nr:hypothetical protein [Actinocorallia sp. API 0066]MCD0449813.1 hypothetical protein [Actinocorallia sp. API 0066]
MTGARVGIIGAGAVGQTVAALLAAADWCERLQIASGSAASAGALVADVEDMLFQTGNPTLVQAVPVEEMRAADAVVVCPRAPFANGATVDVRMAGIHANAPVIVALGRALADYSGVVVVVTNPVDVMAALFARASGAPTVFGVGAATDTARYRGALARHLGVSVPEVSGRVIGEHGDGAVVCAHATRVRGQPVQVPVEEIRAELRARPGRISAGIGRTRIGPAGAVLLALRAALGLHDTVIELSVPAEGVGVPVKFSGGVPTVLPVDLAPEEIRALAISRARQRRLVGELSHLLEGTP